MKTIHFAYILGMPVLLALLWSVSVVNSSEFNFSWAAIELCVLIGTYIMCAHSEVPPVFRLPRGGVHATSFSFC